MHNGSSLFTGDAGQGESINLFAQRTDRKIMPKPLAASILHLDPDASGSDSLSFHVVIADGDRATAAAISAVLAAHDIVCHIFDDGIAALKAARRLLPGLVLLDLNIPGNDGFDVLTALKQDPETRAIPVILLTASEELCDIQRGLALSADDCLAKPFGAHDLLARVRKLLKHKIVRRVRSRP